MQTARRTRKTLITYSARTFALKRGPISQRCEIKVLKNAQMTSSSPDDLRESGSFGRKFAASTIGNVLEWYDFAVFGGLAPVLGDVFFPPSNSVAELMEALAVFGAAFVMRPVGGAIFGYVGDVFGRKLALEISIVMMLVPSVAIGLLPGFSAIGGISTGLLVALRLCQGMAVGGELVTAYVFVAEQAPNRKNAPMWTGLVLDGSNCGTLLGIGVVAIVRVSLSRDELYRWGWRLCFMLGFPLGVAGVILRRGIGDEEPELIAVAPRASAQAVSQGETTETKTDGSCETSRKNPLVEVWKHRRLEMACVAGVCSLWCGGFYTSFVWMGIYYSDRIGQDPIPHGYAINAAMLFVLCLLFVPCAMSTRGQRDLNARAAMVRGQLGLGVVSIPAFVLLTFWRTPTAAVIAQAAIAPFLASFGAGMPFFLVYAFPPNVRVVAIGLAYNVSQAIFGGMAPIAMTAAAKRHPVLPGIILVLVSLCSFLSLRALDAIATSTGHNRAAPPGKPKLQQLSKDSSLFELAPVVASSSRGEEKAGEEQTTAAVIKESANLV